jgi:integrase
MIDPQANRRVDVQRIEALRAHLHHLARFVARVHRRGSPGESGFLAVWRDRDGDEQSTRTNTHYQAVMEVSRNHYGGLRFHDLRHSYATWLVDDGVPPNMVQRVMGHERASTTLDLYTRRTADTSRILAALDDDEEADL